MKKITKFPILQEYGLYETAAILIKSNLVVHEAVSKVILEGSRGLRNCPGIDSDIDLSLVLCEKFKPTEELCDDVIKTTLTAWSGDIELDIAVIFDKRNCKLICLENNEYRSGICSQKMDCLGIYKTQKGYNGFVPDCGIDIEKLFPILTIWRQK